jgi:hypothetical protein
MLHQNKPGSSYSNRPGSKGRLSSRERSRGSLGGGIPPSASSTGGRYFPLNKFIVQGECNFQSLDQQQVPQNLP